MPIRASKHLGLNPLLPKNHLARRQIRAEFFCPLVRIKSLLLARNQFGDNWRVVVDAIKGVSLVNDHELLNGEIIRFSFQETGKKIFTRQPYDWPLRVPIDLLKLKVSVLRQENRKTIFLEAGDTRVLIRSDFDGRRIVMESDSPHSEGGRILEKVFFDFDPFRGRGTLDVGKLTVGSDGEQVRKHRSFRVLGGAAGYRLASAGVSGKHT